MCQHPLHPQLETSEGDRLKSSFGVIDFLILKISSVTSATFVMFIYLKNNKKKKQINMKSESFIYQAAAVRDSRFFALS